MSRDARFEEGGERPMRLHAFDEDDLKVISSLVQDAVFPVTEMTWDRKGRRLALLLNRFRWEDREAAARAGRPFERVRAVLTVEGVEQVSSQGVDRGDRDLVLSLLAVAFEPGAEAPSGRVVLTLAGDGAVSATVEALELTLTDVTRPYVAPSRKAPDHG